MVYSSVATDTRTNGVVVLFAVHARATLEAILQVAESQKKHPRLKVRLQVEAARAHAHSLILLQQCRMCTLQGRCFVLQFVNSVFYCPK